MPFVLPADPASGAVAPASWGDDVRAALNYLANPPACRVYHSANQNIPTVTTTALAFNSERFDTDTMHDTATNNSRITIKTAGVYAVAAGVWFAANGLGNIREAWIQVNGATRIAEDCRAPVGGGGGTRIALSTIYKLAVNDYLEVIAYQDSGSTVAADAFGAAAPEFSATWIGLG